MKFKSKMEIFVNGLSKWENKIETQVEVNRQICRIDSPI